MILIMCRTGLAGKNGVMTKPEHAMRSIPTLAFVTCVLSAAAATAQSHGGGHHGAAAPAPYADLDKRTIKALSEQQISDLRAGRGMGLALPAELNGYPGPLHVLELADALSLTAEQRRRAQALMDAMRAETILIGLRIIRDEAALERLFADRTVTTASLASATRLIAAGQGGLRAAHLRYHLLMAELLTHAQVAKYDRLRGYGFTGATP